MKFFLKYLAPLQVRRQNNMKYRPEIDGLRALSVVAVILFHAGFELFSGGFVGVDVFFVISGYLITTIIIQDIDKKRFSLVHFYERRARRILPVLYVVVVFTLIVSYFTLLPEDLVSLGKSAVSIPLFSSNFYFWSERGYFGVANELKPLVQQADCITIHIPKNDNNVSFIDDEKLSWMKVGASLVNTARGSIVDERSLYNEIKSGRVKAAFDVFWKEPYQGILKEFYPDRFFMTPHVASISIGFLEGCRDDLNKLIEEL